AVADGAAFLQLQVADRMQLVRAVPFLAVVCVLDHRFPVCLFECVGLLAGERGADRLPSPRTRSGGEGETLVAAGGDLVALAAVAADAFWAEIGQERARLAGNVRAHVPGVSLRHQRGADD